MSIGPITIFVEWEDDKAVLILENRGTQKVKISIHCQISSSSGTVLLVNDELLNSETYTKKLSKGFEKWHTFYCLLDGEKQIDLKELVNGDQINAINKYPQVEITPSTSNTAQANDLSPLIRGESELLKEEIENLQVQISTDDQQKIETNVRDSQKHVREMEKVNRADKAIDIVNFENATPSQKAVIILNLIMNDIQQWVDELNQSYVKNSDLVLTLKYAGQAAEEKLKTISNYEQKGEVDIAEYNQFLPQFIKDRLFNGVARFVTFEQLHEKLDKFLDLVGYEIIPIEIGKTKADARVHDIQSSLQTNNEPGTIVEIILPGLQRKADGEIVQKSVVIRGE